ncbi:MAG: reverse gyrase, partial [Desulfurococcaceae archaeon TW002]
NEELAEAELVLYSGTCPNCGGIISDNRLGRGVPCSNCFPSFDGKTLNLREVINELRRSGDLKNLKEFSNALEEEEALNKFFKKCVGSEPWSIQRLWIKRICRRSSFAMIAPTGIGKTTLGLVAALYYSFKGMKSYFIVPTTTLVMQAERKLIEFLNRLGGAASILTIHSRLSKKEKEERMKRLEDPEGFDILITTSRYFMKNYDKISKHDFFFVFVDDVDAVLRGSKAINYLLNLMGFTNSDIEKGLKIIRLKRELGLKSESSELVEEIKKLKFEVMKRRNTNKVLVIASATGNPRGLRVRLFRELMGFEIGARPELIRNIEDTYLKTEDLKNAIEETVKLVKTLGGGGIIYVPADLGVEFAEELASNLRSRRIAAEAIHSRKIRTLEEFISGTIDVLVGVATYYGVLVRGIDLPTRIRYAIFVDVPRHKINLRLEKLSVIDVMRLIPLLRDVVTDLSDKRFLENAFVRLRSVLRRSGSYFLKIIDEVLKGERSPQTASEKLFLEVYERVHELLKDQTIVENLIKHPEAIVVSEEGTLYVLIPDALTYIQASGRTSRLYLGGVSKGLSIIITWNEKLLKALERRLKLLTGEFEFKDLREINLSQIINEVDRTREEILAIGRGELIEDLVKRIDVKTALMIVESPNKARTIARMFGKPSVKEYGRLRVYEVNLGNYTLLITASGGHIYELITDQGVDGVEPTDYVYGVLRRGGVSGKPSFVPVFAPIRRCVKCGYQFASLSNNASCPLCGSESLLSSSDIIQSLREVAYEVDEVLLGTDPDAEGEKIAYDLYHVLIPFNKVIKRIEFHEVTRKAVTNALNNPRDINFKLVKAQLLRRIEDRWVGFSLSGKLQNEFWRDYFCSRLASAISEHSNARSRQVSKYLVLCSKYRESFKRLSAGRVQSPVLGWIVENYEERRESLSTYLLLRFRGLSIAVKIPKDLRNLITRDNISEVLVSVRSSDLGEEQVSPPPPYTTDTALSDISNALGIPASQVMQILQELFEFGLITYHRTDSVRVSDAGIKVAREYLISRFGDSWVKFFEGRSWGVSGAHECIRPTRPVDVEMLRELISEGVIEIPRRLHNTYFRVYDMIFRRFIASQMPKAIIRKKVVEFLVDVVTKDSRRVRLPLTSKEAVSEVVFDGFDTILKSLRVYQTPEDSLYGSGGSDLKYEIKAMYEVPLHTQASVVRTMKERGIGRPSTYAKVIETILKRRYVFSGKRGELIPSLLGIEVYNYLIERYARLVSEERTRVLENKMSLIETDDTLYNDLLKELYEELKMNELLGVVGYEL